MICFEPRFAKGLKTHAKNPDLWYRSARHAINCNAERRVWFRSARFAYLIFSANWRADVMSKESRADRRNKSIGRYSATIQRHFRVDHRSQLNYSGRIWNFFRASVYFEIRLDIRQNSCGVELRNRSFKTGCKVKVRHAGVDQRPPGWWQIAGMLDGAETSPGAATDVRGHRRHEPIRFSAPIHNWR
jgi:hypothetical protein